MLYERWKTVATARGRDLALREAATGHSWTFSDLLEASARPDDALPPVVFAQGQGADFILTVLKAWRNGRVLCPLEPGQAPPTVPLPPPGCVHLKTTSASTGRPRLVAFRPEQLAADATNIVASMGLRPDWPNLAAISLAHYYGFSNLVLPLLLHGVPLLLAWASLPEALRRAADGESDLTLAGVPALWRLWHEARAIPASVRLAISAGAPLPVSLERSVFEAVGLKIHNFYGSSECGGIAYDATATPRTDEACVGAPLRNVDVAVGEGGALAVRGPNVGDTYWPDPDEALAGGRFQTSDLAELREGKVYLRGRASDLINVAGRKLAPETVERVLLEHPAVRECLVFGVPAADRERGEDVVATVMCRSACGGEALRQFLLERLPAWQVPRAWWFVDGPLSDGRGKASRTEWRRRYGCRGEVPGNHTGSGSCDSGR